MKQISAEHVKQAGVLLKKEHEERVRLEKLAAHNDMEKRAEKIAFREIELGACEPFRSHEEFLNKVASLMKEDLDVVEKALERGYGEFKRTDGELVESKQKGNNPWEHYILTGELVNE